MWFTLKIIWNKSYRSKEVVFQIWDWYHKKWDCELLYQQKPLGDIHVQLMIPKGHLETTWPHTTAKIDILFFII